MRKITHLLVLNDIEPEMASVERVIEYAQNRLDANLDDKKEWEETTDIVDLSYENAVEIINSYEEGVVVISLKTDAEVINREIDVEVLVDEFMEKDSEVLAEVLYDDFKEEIYKDLNIKTKGDFISILGDVEAWSTLELENAVNYTNGYADKHFRSLSLVEVAEYLIGLD
jgi:hypothetical protein